MGQAVIVFSFPEPDDPITLGMIIENSKKMFVDVPEVKVHLAISEVAESVISLVSPGEETQSNLIDHARRELELLGNDNDFNDSIIRAVRGFVSYGHSGGSAPVAIALLNDLLQYKNIAPLTDSPDEWNHIEEDVAGNANTWQSKRNPAAFSDNGGKTYWLVDDDNDSDPRPRYETKRMYNAD